ncbi:hypothetical protein DW251_00905 [Clostridium sp. AM22-11AC]|nr:hypothetical protein DW251_00905 [Clostridium sp. AM22-11AC]
MIFVFGPIAVAAAWVLFYVISACL